MLERSSTDMGVLRRKLAGDVLYLGLSTDLELNAIRFHRFQMKLVETFCGTKIANVIPLGSVRDWADHESKGAKLWKAR